MHEGMYRKPNRTNVNRGASVYPSTPNRHVLIPSNGCVESEVCMPYISRALIRQKFSGALGPWG